MILKRARSGRLRVEQCRAVLDESIERQRLGEDVGRHVVRVHVLDADDVPLVEVAHIGRPALEVLRLGGEALSLDNVRWRRCCPSST